MKRRNIRNQKSTDKQKSNKDVKTYDLTKGLKILEYHNLKKEEKRLENKEKIVKENRKKIKRLQKEKLKNNRTKEDMEIKEKKITYDNNKINISLKPIIIMLATIFAVFLIYIFFKYCHVFGISFSNNNTFEKSIKLDINLLDNSKILTYNNNLLIYNGKNIKAYNNKGKEVFTYNLEDQFVPEIYVKNKYLAISNSSNGIIYFFEDNEEILNKKIDGKIINIYLDEKGNFAAEYSKTGYKRILDVFNKKGKKIYSINIDGSGISDLISSDLSKKVYIIQTDTSSLSVGLSIKYIDVTKNEFILQEIKKVENAILQNSLISGNNIFLLLDRMIIKIDTKKVKTKEILNLTEEPISHIAISNNYYALIGDTIIEESEISKYKMGIYRYDNTNTFLGEVTNIPEKIYTKGDLIYMLYQDRLQISNKWGMVIRDINIGFSPKEIVAFNNGKSYGIIYSNKVYLLDI